MFAVYKIEWTEYECGWGQRPDGITYHVSKTVADAFKKRNETGGDKECYSRGSEPMLIEVSEEDFIKTQRKGSFWKTVR